MTATDGHRCPRPADWVEAALPTAAQILTVLDASSPDAWCEACRLRVVDAMHQDAQRGLRCMMASHDDFPLQVANLHQQYRGLLAELATARQRLIVAHRGAQGDLNVYETAARYRLAWQSAQRRARRAIARGKADAAQARQAGWIAAHDHLLAQLDQLD